jgi:uncharacterized membrane protein
VTIRIIAPEWARIVDLARAEHVLLTGNTEHSPHRSAAMSEPQVPMTGNADLPAGTDPADASTAKVIYVLYLIGIVIGVTSLVGVIMAYVKRDGAPAWVQSHYRFQIRTFWIGVLYSIIGLATWVFIVGWFILLFVLVWLIVRCIKGMGWAERGEPVRNETTWMFP